MSKFLQPMLAHVYKPEEFSDEYRFAIQPKYDGFRCIIAKIDGQIQLYSRSMNLLTVDHVLEDAKKLENDGWDFSEHWLDGELYSHGESFQTIQSMIKNESNPKHKEIKFVCYDCIPLVDLGMGFALRSHILRSYIVGLYTYIYAAPVFLGRLKNEAESMLQEITSEGFEGIILRNPNGHYKQGRSKDLLKYKLFLEEEFLVIDVNEGKGKNVGTAIFTCKTEDDKTFKVTAPGDYAEKSRIWANMTDYLAKMVTVKYQEKTDAGIPRFPIAIGFKEDR